MINAKEELLEHIESRTIKCATITLGDDDDNSTFQLPCGYSKLQYNRFIAILNFKYDNGYGSQELFGTVWYTDGTWSERGEYDGSEWWEHRKLPQIPAELGEL